MRQTFAKYLLGIAILLGGMAQLFATSNFNVDSVEDIIGNVSEASNTNQLTLSSKDNQGHFDFEKFFTEITESEEVEGSHDQNGNSISFHHQVSIAFLYAFSCLRTLEAQSNPLFDQNESLSRTVYKKYIQFQVFRI